MTVEANNAAQSPEERLRARALDLLKTETLEVILGSDEPLRTGEVGRRVGDRLGMQLNEAESGGLATLVRMVMDSEPLFSQANRQWDLALRMGRAEGDRRKPVERAIEDVADLLGRPAKPQVLATFVGAVYGREPDYYEKMIERLLETRPQFFRVGEDRVGITRWLLDLSSDDPEDVEFDNFDDTDELDRLRALAKGQNGDDPVAYAGEIIRKSEEPVENKPLIFLAWSRGQREPKEIFTGLFAEGDLTIEKGRWVTQEGRQTVIEEIRRLARDPESAADVLAAGPSDEDADAPFAPATQSVRVSDEDLDSVYSFMEGETRSYRVPELCQDALEAFPGSRNYQAIHDSLLNRMQEDGRFLWVGAERFRTQGSVPEEALAVPEGLAFPPVAEYLDEEGVEQDRVVEPRDWKFMLDEQIQHYQVQDIGDDSTAPGETPAQLVSSVPLHHYVAGTRYLRNSDQGFFPAEPELQQITLSQGDGSKVDIWVNLRLGLILGLKDWYDANLPWVGGQFTIERGEGPEDYRLVYNGGDVDPLMDIPLEQLQPLLQLRAEAISEALPLTEVVKRILQGAGEGLQFVSLFTRVNVVRRTRRAHLASILSSQRYFTQSPQTPGVWSYDEKRTPKGKKKAGPKRPMRDYGDDDDDLEEIE